MQAAEITGHVGTQHRGWRLKLQRQGLNDLAQESMAIAQLNDGRTASRKFYDRLWKKKQWAPRQSVDQHANARCKPRPAGVSELCDGRQVIVGVAHGTLSISPRPRRLDRGMPRK